MLLLWDARSAVPCEHVGPNGNWVYLEEWRLLGCYAVSCKNRRFGELCASIAVFIVTAVRTSNPTWIYCLRLKSQWISIASDPLWFYCPQHLTTLYASTAYYGDSFTILYVDDVRTSQETHLWSSTCYYRDSFNLLYVDDVSTSQETHVRSTTACYGVGLVFTYQFFSRVFNHLRMFVRISVQSPCS
jgi:hypothetical protein